MVNPLNRFFKARDSPAAGSPLDGAPVGLDQLAATIKALIAEQHPELKHIPPEPSDDAGLIRLNAGGTALQLSLDNLQRQLAETHPAGEADEAAVLIQGFVDQVGSAAASMMAAELGGAERDADRLLPTLRPAEYAATIAAGADPDTPAGKLPFALPFGRTGLSLMIYEDLPASIRMCCGEDLAELELDADAAVARALANFRRDHSELRVEGGDDLFLLTAGPGLQPALLLVDPIWEQIAAQGLVTGDPVVALPTRELLLLTGTGHPDQVSRLREIAYAEASTGSHAITADLLTRRDGQWSILEG